MSNNVASLSVADAAKKIKQQLETYVSPRGGVVKIMANLRHLWEEVFELCDSPRVMIVYMGEVARGEFQGGSLTEMSRVEREWQVVVMRGHGFNNLLESGETENKEVFYDSVETIRDGIRCMENISEEFPVDYRSIKPLPSIANGQVANIFMDAYAIQFFTANDIPKIMRGANRTQ